GERCRQLRHDVGIETAWRSNRRRRAPSNRIEPLEYSLMAVERAAHISFTSTQNVFYPVSLVVLLCKALHRSGPSLSRPPMNQSTADSDTPRVASHRITERRSTFDSDPFS